MKNKSEESLHIKSTENKEKIIPPLIKESYDKAKDKWLNQIKREREFDKLHRDFDSEQVNNNEILYSIIQELTDNCEKKSDHLSGLVEKLNSIDEILKEKASKISQKFKTMELHQETE